MQADGNLRRLYARDQDFVKMLCLPSYLVFLVIFLRRSYQYPLDLFANKGRRKFCTTYQIKPRTTNTRFAKFTIHNFQTLVTDISSLPISNKWMIWYSDSNLHIFMPKFQDYALTIEILGVLGFLDNSEIPLSLQMMIHAKLSLF